MFLRDKTRLFFFFFTSFINNSSASERRDANATVECSLHNPRIILRGNEHVVFDWPSDWALTLESDQTRRVSYYSWVDLRPVRRVRKISSRGSIGFQFNMASSVTS